MPDPRHALHQPRWNERHALDDRHQVALLVDRIATPRAGGIEVKRRVEVFVRSIGTILGVNAARENRRAALARRTSNRGIPRRSQITGDCGLGPDHEIQRAARLQVARHGHQLRHDAIGVTRIPFLPEAFVRLNEADGPQLAQRERPDAPRAVAPGRDDRREHERESPHDAGLSHRPTVRRFYEHDIAPTQPERHPTRASDIGPLDQHRGVGERGAEPEPGEPDVALVPHRPFDRRPGHRKGDPQRQHREAQAYADHEPEEQRVPQAE